MSATIPPPIVQPGFGFGNLTWVQWLATGGLTGRATMEDIRDVCAKSSVFIDRPRHRDGDRRGDGACRRRAIAGSRRVGLRPRPAGPPTSAPARRVYHRGGGGAAAAAAFAGIVGTGLAIAATQNRRAYYDDYDGYGGPVYYGGGPVYYGGPGYYGPGYGSYGGSSEFGGQPYRQLAARGLCAASPANRLVTMFRQPLDPPAAPPRGRRISSQNSGGR